MDSAVIDGGGTVNRFFWIEGGNTITINGLQFKNFKGWGILIHGGAGLVYSQINLGATGPAHGNTVMNNIFQDGNTNLEGDPNFAAITAFGDVTNTSIKNNVVSNTTGTGISAIENNDGPSDNVTGLDVENNVILNANTSSTIFDVGAFHVDDRGKRSTGITIKNNFIRDYGTNAGATRAFYLDDDTSNATVSGNIAVGNGSTAVLIHSGNNNIFIGNIFDISGTGHTGVLQYADSDTLGMTGNVWTNNIILAKYTAWRNTQDYGGQGGPYQIVGSPAALAFRNNFYFNYANSSLPDFSVGGPAFKDANPITSAGDPGISGWTYTIAAGSPVYNAPVNFPHIAGGWGPPGYTIPQTGTLPSSPH